MADHEAKLAQALAEATERVTARISLPGLSEQQNLELQAAIREAVKEDSAPKVKEAFRLAAERLELVCTAKAEIAGIESEIKELRELELFDVGAKDEVGLLARAIQRERIDVASREMETGKDALSAAKEHLRFLQGLPLAESPQRAYVPEPWPRKVQYLQHRAGAFEPDEDEEDDRPSEFTNPRIKSRDIPRV